MAKGISIRFYDKDVAKSNLTNLVCLWWDSTDVYDFGMPIGRTDVATTDADGDLILDISDVSGLATNDYGYLIVRKEDGTDHKDSLVFQGRVQVTTVTGGTKLSYNSGWTRPADWLDLGTLPSSGDSKMIALYAVWNGGPNWCAFKFTCSDSSQYTIDWGDGSATENVDSATTAYHSFDYDDLDGDTETGIAAARSCTFQDTGDTVTLSGHGFQNGTEISFSNVTTTTGISTYTRYWVVGVSGDTFQVAATKGGTALTLTTNGTGAVYLPGYRQALITVVPTTSGKAFTELDTNIRHTSASAVAYRTGFLDIYLNAPSMTTLTLGAVTQNVVHSLMERFQAPELGTVTDFSYMFSYAYSLQSIPLLDTSAGTNFYAMFSNATSLQSIPLLDTSAGTNFSRMFASASSLQSIPLLDTSAGTNFSYMFYYATSLQSIPLLDTSAGTNFSYMFSYAQSLQSIPLLDTSAGTNFSYMFSYAYSLQSIPLLDTSAGTNFSYMFSYCKSLQSIPLLDTSAGLDFSYMFTYAYSLQSIPLLDTSTGTNFCSMFDGASSLQSIPLLDTSAGTNFNYMFYYAHSLQSIPLLNTSAGTNFSYMFSGGAYSLQRGALKGTAQTITYPAAQLSGAALDEIYTNLATVTSKTITVTGNYGTASDTPSIATAKGWTVVG